MKGHVAAPTIQPRDNRKLNRERDREREREIERERERERERPVWNICSVEQRTQVKSIKEVVGKGGSFKDIFSQCFDSP